ncbi:MAG: hypothetical protein ABIG96_06230 [Candidatus Micrarchaeota archaeon]
MNKKAISMVMILLGVAFSTLALNQLNQMSISSAQSELARPVAEAQIAANEQFALSYGQTQDEIDKTSKEARDLIEKTIAATNQSYLQTALIDGILGLVLLFAGLITFPKEL